MREIWANDNRQYSFLHTSLDLSINTLCLLLLIVHPNLKGRRAYIHDWWNSKQNICISKIYKKSHINMYAGILVLRGYTYTHAQTHTHRSSPSPSLCPSSSCPTPPPSLAIYPSPVCVGEPVVLNLSSSSSSVGLQPLVGSEVAQAPSNFVWTGCYYIIYIVGVKIYTVVAFSIIHIYY